MVLKWDSRNEDKGNHGKLDNLWKGPFIIQAFRGNNAFILKDIEGAYLPGGTINDWMLKHYVPLE